MSSKAVTTALFKIKSPIVRDLSRLLPVAFILGAGMEFTMQKTGFYRVVTRKEGERRATARLEDAELRERRSKNENEVLAAFEHQNAHSSPSTTAVAASASAPPNTVVAAKRS